MIIFPRGWIEMKKLKLSNQDLFSLMDVLITQSWRSWFRVWAGVLQNCTVARNLASRCLNVDIELFIAQKQKEIEFVWVASSSSH